MALENRRLLFSLAHPDDESFGYAGTLARYTSQDVDVHLICATNGDVGTVSEELMEGFPSVAALRLWELACAARTLDLSKVHTFGYRDSGMQGSPDNEHPNALAAQDIDEVTRRVTHVIRQVRPQVVVTFDPDGGYGHPDHVAIHHATVRAFHAAGDATRYPEQLEAGLAPYQPQKLYYGTFSRKLMRFLVNIMPLFGADPTRMGRNKDMNYKEIVKNEWPIHARIGVGDYQDVVQQAWDCHASQQFTGGGLLTRVVSHILRSDDTYMRAHPPANGKLRESDLFEGVVFQETEVD